MTTQRSMNGGVLAEPGTYRTRDGTTVTLYQRDLRSTLTGETTDCIVWPYAEDPHEYSPERAWSPDGRCFDRFGWNDSLTLLEKLS